MAAMTSYIYICSSLFFEVIAAQLFKQSLKNVADVTDPACTCSILPCHIPYPYHKILICGVLCK